MDFLAVSRRMFFSPRIGVLVFLLGNFSTAFAETNRAVLVRDVLDRLVARNEGRGGGVVRIANASGVLVEDAAGLMAGPDSPQMRADTPFEVASITKAVTSATVLRLVEKGRLTLDATVGELLPKHAVGFNGRITVRQLLSHTSGLPNYWTDGRLDRVGNNAFLRAFLAEPRRVWLPDDILAAAREIPAKKRGGSFHYSDTNYVLLGLIIEKAAGAPLHRVYREEIFDPLEMRDTWLTYKEPPRGAAPSHRYEGDEDMHEVPRQSADWAGGGLMSTARDLEKFLRGLASGRLFHNADTLDVMREAVPVGGQGISYGLGLYRVKLGPELGELWGHDGHGNSFAYYWPERGITFTGTLNQTENDWWPLVQEFIEGGNPENVIADSERSFELTLSTGWDSLFMDRGMNALREQGYGSGIFWTSLDLTFGLTDVDFLTLNAWQCFATREAEYHELDASVVYTRLFGNFSLSLQYMFTHGYAGGNFFSNDLTAEVAYELGIGPVTLIPSVGYCFALGPDADDGSGFVKMASSYLLFRLDGKIPLYRDIVGLEPWGAFGINFEYNTKEGVGGDPEAFVGPNNIECGLAVPVKLNRHLTVSVFGAYSRALVQLTGTQPDTFWGGGSVTFSY